MGHVELEWCSGITGRPGRVLARRGITQLGHELPVTFHVPFLARIARQPFPEKRIERTLFQSCTSTRALNQRFVGTEGNIFQQTLPPWRNAMWHPPNEPPNPFDPKRHSREKISKDFPCSSATRSGSLIAAACKCGFFCARGTGRTTISNRRVHHRNSEQKKWPTKSDRPNPRSKGEIWVKKDGFGEKTGGRFPAKKTRGIGTRRGISDRRGIRLSRSATVTSESLVTQQSKKLIMLVYH